MLLGSVAAGGFSDSLQKEAELAFKYITGCKGAAAGICYDLRILKCCQDEDFCICADTYHFGGLYAVQIGGCQVQIHEYDIRPHSLGEYQRLCGR